MAQEVEALLKTPLLVGIVFVVTCTHALAQGSLLGVQGDDRSAPAGTLTGSSPSKGGELTISADWGYESSGVKWVKTEISGPVERIRSTRYFAKGYDPDGQFHALTPELDTGPAVRNRFTLGNQVTELLAVVKLGPPLVNHEAREGGLIARNFANAAEAIVGEVVWLRVRLPSTRVSWGEPVDR